MNAIPRASGRPTAAARSQKPCMSLVSEAPARPACAIQPDRATISSSVMRPMIKPRGGSANRGPFSADPFSSFAGEGGAIGRRKTPVFRRAMAPDGVWSAPATLDRIARPSPRAFSDPSLLSAPHPALRATFPASRRRRGVGLGAAACYSLPQRARGREEPHEQDRSRRTGTCRPRLGGQLRARRPRGGDLGRSARGDRRGAELRQPGPARPRRQRAFARPSAAFGARPDPPGGLPRRRARRDELRPGEHARGPRDEAAGVRRTRQPRRSRSRARKLHLGDPAVGFQRRSARAVGAASSPIRSTRRT